MANFIYLIKIPPKILICYFVIMKENIDVAKRRVTYKT